MKRETRHRILQRVFWTPPGFRLIAWLRNLQRRWEYVVLNRSLHSPTNGEYWLISQLPPHPRVLDVGFHTGEFSREVLRQRGDAQIVGFDPSRLAARAFQTSFGNDPRVRLEPAAVSNAEGKSTFYDSHSMSSALVAREANESESYIVPVVTLDAYAERHGLRTIDLLKIDAEGYDLNVLEGAARLLAEQRIDVFLFEFADGWIDNRRTLKEAARYLGSKPCRLFRLFNGFLAPFHYDVSAERHDLGCMFVGVSNQRLERGGPPQRVFPC